MSANKPVKKKIGKHSDGHDKYYGHRKVKAAHKRSPKHVTTKRNTKTS